MRVIQASEAKTKFLSLLDDVERGETLVITRHGKKIAEISPIASARDRPEKVRRIVKELGEIGKSLQPLTIEELIAMKHEGHKY